MVLFACVVAGKWRAEAKPSEEEETVKSGEPHCDAGCPCAEAGDECDDECDCCGEDADSEHGDDCCHHGYIHPSDPNDPVTSMCVQINKDLEEWEEKGELTPEKLNEALGRFDEALKMTAKHMEALLGKAYVQGELGQSEAAVETLLKALEVDAKDFRAQQMLSEMGEFQDDGPDLELIVKFMDQKGNPTPKFKAALVEIFNRFAVGEGDNKALTKQAMDKFHDAVNGGPLSSDAMDFLFCGEWELDDKGNITQDGFISFYLNQTFTDPTETINDLKKLGYDAECNPTTSSSTPTSSSATPTASSAAPTASN